MSSVQSSSWISAQRTVMPRSSAMCEPRGNIGVVVEARDDDFVSGLEVAANRAGDGEGQRGHVGTEDDFVGAAVQEVGHGAARLGDHGVGAAAGGVGSAGVGVVVAQIVGDGVDDALRDLRSAGAVEECGGVAVDGLGERGELGADVGEVEGGGRGVFGGRHGELHFYHDESAYRSYRQFEERLARGLLERPARYRHARPPGGA